MQNENFNLENIFEGNFALPWIKDYIDFLMEQAKLTDMDQELKQVFREKISSQIQETMGMVLMDALDDKKLEEYLSLMERLPHVSFEYLQEWIKLNAPPDLEQRIKDALLNFSKDFVTKMEEAHLKVSRDFNIKVEEERFKLKHGL